MKESTETSLSQGRAAAIIELSSTFLQTILTRNYSKDPKIWSDFANFKNELYDKLTQLPDGKQTYSPFASVGGQASEHIYQNGNISFDEKKHHSINTLLFTKIDPYDDDIQLIKDLNFKSFSTTGKNFESNNITEFLPTVNQLRFRFDTAAFESLKANTDGLGGNFGGSRFIIPSKSAFYRVVAFWYLENLLLDNVNQSQTILKNLFQVFYQSKITFKGPHSGNPFSVLRNTFCGYFLDLYRHSLTGRKAAVAALYKMINHDSMFDQCLVSLVKEIIIHCLGEKEFIGQNVKHLSEPEVQKLIDIVRNSGEISDTLIDLVSAIFQITLNIFSIDEKGLREKAYFPKSDGTNQALSMKIIAQNYKGYLHYFIIYSKDSDSGVSRPFTNTKQAGSYVEMTQPAQGCNKHLESAKSTKSSNTSTSSPLMITSPPFQHPECMPLMIQNEMLKGDEPLSEDFETYNILDFSKSEQNPDQSKKKSNGKGSDTMIHHKRALSEVTQMSDEAAIKNKNQDENGQEIQQTDKKSATPPVLYERNIKNPFKDNYNEIQAKVAASRPMTYDKGYQPSAGRGSTNYEKFGGYAVNIIVSPAMNNSLPSKMLYYSPNNSNRMATDPSSNVTVYSQAKAATLGGRNPYKFKEHFRQGLERKKDSNFQTFAASLTTDDYQKENCAFN